jgi:hypothetical protein
VLGSVSVYSPRRLEIEWSVYIGEFSMRNSLVIASLGLASIGCRSSSNNHPDTGGSDSNIAGAVTIQMIQDPSMPAGTQVAVTGVVVTAIDTFGGTTGNFWIEEPDGGPNSGVLVYKGDAATVATLQPGSIVSITGAVKDEFALTGSNADPTGRTDTELEPVAGGTMTITITGTGTVPAPAKVDALMYGQISDADSQGSNFSAAWKQWDGVLVTMTNISAVSAPKAFGSTKPTPADDYSFGITGVAKVEGSLSDITMSGIARNTCLASVTGIVDYFYDYLVLPRTTADLVTGGTNCVPAETMCDDGIDNDGNGFADCGDNNCMITATTCQDTTQTIATLDAAADAAPTLPTGTLPTKGVVLDGLCVVAVNGSSGYVATNANAAADNGIYVFGGFAGTGITAGMNADLIATADGYHASSSSATDRQLELDDLTLTAAAGSCVPKPMASNATMASLSTDSTGHPLIGSLVTLTPTSAFKVTTAIGSTGFGKVTSGNTVVAIGSGFLAAGYTPDPAGTCYTSLTGIWTYDTTGAGSYEILPTVAPTASGTACTGM